MKRRSGFQVMRRLIGLVRPLTGFMCLAVLLGLAGHLCAAAIPVLGGYALLSLAEGAAAAGLTGLFVVLGLCALARGLLRYGEQACNHYIAFKLLALLRDRVFRALRRLCPAKLEGRDKGDLISVITSDIELLEVFYAHTISPILIAVLFCAGLCVFIGSLHPLLALVALAAYGVVGVAIPLTVSRCSGADGLRFRTRSGQLSAFVLDSLRGLDEILQYRAGAARLAEMEARTEALAADEKRMKRTAGRSTAATNAAVLLADLAMLAAASMLCLQGRLSPGGALLATLALMSSFGPCIALANLGSTLQQTFAAGNRVLDILEETPVTADVAGQAAVDFSGAGLEQVSFDYGGAPVLRSVSAELPRGAVVGLVGRSGSGKSTVLKLLMRFWDVRTGQVRISGRPVGEINTADLRDMEAWMTQDTHLFRDSIRSNLCIARPDATDEELEAACRRAAVHDFIAGLPQGYDTPVGELGDRLSGGERQRLGLARAFLHDAPFLLLDEPTSNLDSLNEAVILRALHEQRADRTVVLVSHRTSTMKIADTVYTVEEGRLR